MQAKAEIKYVRVSARKARLVLDLVKGKTVENANFILDSTNKRSAALVKKAVNSAFANLNSGKQDKFAAKDVFISKIKADGGPMLKRYRAATMGRATPVRHRTTHIKVELEARGGEAKGKEAKKKGV